MGVAWTDGRSDDMRRPAAGAGGEGAARCVAYEVHGYKQAGQTGRHANRRPNARFWLVIIIIIIHPFL